MRPQGSSGSTRAGPALPAARAGPACWDGSICALPCGKGTLHSTGLCRVVPAVWEDKEHWWSMGDPLPRVHWLLVTPSLAHCSQRGGRLCPLPSPLWGHMSFPPMCCNSVSWNKSAHVFSSCPEAGNTDQGVWRSLILMPRAECARTGGVLVLQALTDVGHCPPSHPGVWEARSLSRH